jgi:hypothetical protein
MNLVDYESLDLRARFTWSQILSPKSLMVNPCNLNCREHGKLGLTTSHGSQVLVPDDDMDAYMATLFGGEARDSCLELGGAKS